MNKSTLRAVRLRRLYGQDDQFPGIPHFQASGSQMQGGAPKGAQYSRPRRCGHHEAPPCSRVGTPLGYGVAVEQQGNRDTNREPEPTILVARRVRSRSAATLIRPNVGSAVAAGVRSGGFDRRRQQSGVGSYVDVSGASRARRAARERPFVTACYK